MTHEIIISGFGGQGVMAIGKTLAEAGMHEGLAVSWLPSYGPEMRGGTANCAVVLTSGEIISPMVQEPTELIAMNKPSLTKFEPTIAPGGMVFVNSSITEIKAHIPMNEVLRYAPDLRSMTGGQGVFTMEFAHYEEAPPPVAEKVIAENAKERKEE